MGRFSNLGRAYKEAIKETLWLLNTHRPGPKNDIFLFSTRRSGSTWLMEVIAANRGVKYVDQPLSVHSASSSQLPHLPVVEGGHLVCLDEEQLQQVQSYLQAVLDGRLQVNAPWEFWRPEFDVVSDRLVLKILSSKGLIDWIDVTFEGHIVYSTRHPIPVALSVMRNAWGLTAKAYLRNPGFVDQYLDDDQRAYCWDVLARGPLLQQHVLNWALENLIPLRLLSERPHWLYVSYEEAVLHPEATIERLAEELDLDGLERMKRTIQQPSRSTRTLRSSVSGRQDAQEIIRRWKADVSKDDERAAFEVLDVLGLSIYRRGELVPAAR